MIGSKVRSVVERWTTALREGGEIPMQLYEGGCAELLDAATLADAMERRRTRARLRVVGSDDAADPVVSLDAWRRRIPAQPHRRPAGPQGGPAA